MKIPTGSLFIVALLLVGLAAGVGIVQLRQVVNTPKAGAVIGNVLFSPTSLTLPPDGNVTVVLDPQNNPLGFAKVDLVFDKNVVSITQVDLNTVLKTVITAPDLSAANTTGVLSASLGLATADRGNPPVTAFNFMTIKFQKKATNGSQTSLTFNNTTSQIVDMSSQQLVMSSTPATIIVSVSTASSPTPTPYVGQPNSCGGTCGSNNNCQAGLFCFSGFCRNPLCKETKDCKCIVQTPTPKPTTNIIRLPAPSVQPTPVASADPVKIYNLDLQSLEPTPTPAPKPTVWQNFLNFFLRLFGIKY